MKMLIIPIVHFLLKIYWNWTHNIAYLKKNLVEPSRTGNIFETFVNRVPQVLLTLKK